MAGVVLRPGPRFRPRQAKVINALKFLHPPVDHLRYRDVGEPPRHQGTKRLLCGPGGACPPRRSTDYADGHRFAPPCLRACVPSSLLLEYSSRRTEGHEGRGDWQGLAGVCVGKRESENVGTGAKPRSDAATRRAGARSVARRELSKVSPDFMSPDFAPRRCIDWPMRVGRSRRCAILRCLRGVRQAFGQSVPPESLVPSAPE